MACVCKGEVWYEPTEEHTNSFANIHKKEFQIIKQNIPEFYCGTVSYNEYRDINYNRENNSFNKHEHYEHEILDFLHIVVYQPSRGRSDDYNGYYGQIIDKYYSDNNYYNNYYDSVSYDLRLLEDDSFITINCNGDNYVSRCISYDLVQNKIKLHAEIKEKRIEKRIESQRKTTEAIITKITQKKILVP